VNIEPKKFVDHTFNPLHLTNNNWFINLTNTPIPSSVSTLLQLGGNFCLPIDNSKKKQYTNLLRIWNAITVISVTDKTKIRNMVVPFFHRFIHKKASENVIEKTLSSLEKSTNSFCKNNPDIIFTRADKGNVTVALNKTVYNKKMEELLQDKNTYEIVKKNLINSIEKTKFHNKTMVSKEIYL